MIYYFQAYRRLFVKVSQSQNRKLKLAQQLTDYQLTNDQHHAIVMDQTANQFQCFLLQGVTGSGKTQVFSELIDRMIKRGYRSLLAPKLDSQVRW